MLEKQEKWAKRGDLLKIKSVMQLLPELDVLPQKIFVHDIKNDEKEFIKNYWVKDDGLDKEIIDLTNKLKSSTVNLIFLKGPLGSGKTTLIHYLIKLPEIEDSILIDFNSKPYNDYETKLFIAEFQHDLAISIKAVVNSYIRPEEEVKDFWDNEFKKTDLPEIFNTLKSGVQEKESEFDEGCRKEIRNEKIISYLNEWNRLNYPPSKLNKISFGLVTYYLELWSYVLEKKFNRSTIKMPIFIDNVDHLSLREKQQELVFKLKELANCAHGKIIVAIRNETFMKDYLDNIIRTEKDLRLNNEEVVDAINHTSVPPSKIIQNSIDIFLKNKDKVIEEIEVPTEKLNNIIKILRFIKKENNWKIFSKFVDKLFVHNVRNALLFVSIIAETDLSYLEGNFSIHKIKRMLLSRGKPYYTSFRNPYVQNIFRVGDETTTGHIMLLKLRILHLLFKKGRRLEISQIVTDMKKLKYSISEIKSALNDMMELGSQLLYSDGLRAYNSEDLASSPGDTVFLTDIGINYYKKICNDLDYLQEIILDTDTPYNSDRIVQLKDTLAERFHIMIEVLEELFVQEKKDYEDLCDSHKGVNFEEFLPQNSFFSYRILISIADDMNAILDDAIENARTKEEELELQDTKNLISTKIRSFREDLETMGLNTE